MINDLNRVGVLVISGFNIRAVIAVCRFARENHIPLHIVTKNANDPIYLTEFKSDVFLERHLVSFDVSEFTNWIYCLKGLFKYCSILIMPTTEYLNRFMLVNRAAIQKAGGIIPLVSTDLYEKISDKYSFTDLCVANEIPVPFIYDAPPKKFPFVAKPVRYLFDLNKQLKPYLIYEESDWESFLSVEEVSDFYYQEYVYGRSIYLFLHLSKNGGVKKYSQENLLQQARGGSIILAKRHGFYEHKESDRYVSMFINMRFHGLVMIEVRQCQNSGRYVMIEANPRLWGPMQFVQDNNVDLIGALLMDYGVILNSAECCNRHNDAEYYFWSGGLSDINKPYSYHNFSPEEFVDCFNSFLRCDVFCRQDTMALYKFELGQAII